MKLAHWPFFLAMVLALSMTACSKTDNPSTASAPGANPTVPATPVAAPTAGTSYDTVAANAKGFSVGSLMSAQAVYILFDPQCPHCGHLWQTSMVLHNKVKFVWIPISFSAKSLPQAVALLSATHPLETMSAHEESLLAGKGGMSAPSSLPPELEQAIKANTRILTALGVDSVPFILAKNRRTGEIVSHNGAMETAALAQLLGVD